jgi:hypothetical protein
VGSIARTGGPAGTGFEATYFLSSGNKLQIIFFMWLADKIIDWHSILFGEEHWSFLPQVAIKTIIMFIVILISLRLIGRRGTYHYHVGFFCRRSYAVS